MLEDLKDKSIFKRILRRIAKRANGYCIKPKYCGQNKWEICVMHKRITGSLVVDEIGYPVVFIANDGRISLLLMYNVAVPSDREILEFLLENKSKICYEPALVYRDDSLEKFMIEDDLLGNGEDLENER